MDILKKYWYLFVLILAAAAYFIWSRKASGAIVATGTTAENSTKSSAIIPGGIAGKPIVVMYGRPADPAGEKRLIVQMKTPDSLEFNVGQMVQLQGSKTYPGTYNVWYTYEGTSPTAGPVRELYLDTKFIANESGVKVAKA